MKAALASIFFLLLSQLYAQVTRDSPLFQTMKTQSSDLYERGFNQCDMAYLESVAHKDLQSYYERDDAQNRAKFFEDVHKLNCSDTPKKTIRIVDPNSLEVFSLNDNGVMYGAVQSGSIDFYVREASKPDIKTGTAKFTQVWLLENGKWLLKEIMSFAHEDIK